MKVSRIIQISIPLMIMLSACRPSTEMPENIEADYIRYDVNYLDEQAGDIPTRILPGTMDAYYTRYFVLTRIEGFFNQFSLIQIANLRSRKVSTLLNFFGNKIYYTCDSRELPAGIRPIPGMQLNFTDDTAVIAGLTSYRVEVFSDEDPFDIFYTKQIDVKRPNITTPYPAVNYPLSDFRIQMSYLKMHLVGTIHEKRLIESRIFTIPEDYKPVSKDTMERIINSLFTKD